MKTIFISLILLLLQVTQTKALQVELDSLANKVEVRRISSPTITIKRPMLSLNTFFSGDNYSKGYDLEYVLNHLAQNEITLNAILKDAENRIPSEVPNSANDEGIINNYSRYLQHQAFRSLLTYVRSIEEQDAVIVSEIDYSLVFSQTDHLVFIENLKKSSSFFLVSEAVNDSVTNDYVKWAQSLANYARAIDLYLAFEIAVDVYDHDNADQYLLSMAEKETLLINLANGILHAHEKMTKDHSLVFGINEDDTESGNRPLKMYGALGYASLVNQDIEDVINSMCFDL